jgi:hypothetical protein
LRAGEWIQVRSKEEVLKTLDKSGRVERLPFMPEMFEFCGKRFRVLKRAHKTCDPPNGLTGRRMLNAVHLEEVRCSGAAHGGCEARCLMLWKEAWLERVAVGAVSVGAPRRPLSGGRSPEASGRCTELDVFRGTQNQENGPDSDEPIFRCQSTDVSLATQPLHWWDLRQYAEDYTSGNVRLSQFLTAFLLFLFAHVVSAGLGVGSVLRWVYDTIQRMRNGTPYPFRSGQIPPGAKTPSVKLDLQPGELVKIRGYQEILATIDEKGHNRGMYFDAEMVPYCGGTYRVLNRVSKIINEKTGRMQYLKNDCIMLDGVVCLACYATQRRFCPRAIYPYWREIWLERVGSTRSAAEDKKTALTSRGECPDSSVLADSSCSRSPHFERTGVAGVCGSQGRISE